MMSNVEMLALNFEAPYELNLAYIPFINNGGLFVSTEKVFPLGEKLFVNVQLPGILEDIIIEGKVVWCTPKNALHHSQSGIGIQFVGPNAQAVRKQIEACIDPACDVGGYTYGISENIAK